MKSTENPAWMLTGHCIKNSFLTSGKKHILLTGRQGSGKTTLLTRLTDNTLPGIVTWAVPQEGVYLREISTGREIRIGVYDLRKESETNQMQPVFLGFVALGIPALQRCAKEESEWISVDEVGYVELNCPEYCIELLKLMEKKHLVAGIRKDNKEFLNNLLLRDDVFAIDMDRPFGTLGCVIMASGEGKRFGSNKLMADFGGEPMIASALKVTEGIFAKRVVVTRHAEVAEYCEAKGVDVVLHDKPFRSDTVRLGLEAVGDVDGCLFCPGDQPLLSLDTVMSLAISAVCDPESIWRPEYEGNPGAPILFPKKFFPELINLPEGKGGGFVAKKYPDQVRTNPVQDALELMDADTPEALENLITHKKSE